MELKAVNTRVVEYRIDEPTFENITIEELEGFCREARAHGFSGSQVVGTVMNGNACVGVFVNETTPLVPADPLPAWPDKEALEHAKAALSGKILPPLPHPSGRLTRMTFRTPKGEVAFNRRPQHAPTFEYRLVHDHAEPPYGDWDWLLGIIKKKTDTHAEYLAAMATMVEVEQA